MTGAVRCEEGRWLLTEEREEIERGNREEWGGGQDDVSSWISMPVVILFTAAAAAQAPHTGRKEERSCGEESGRGREEERRGEEQPGFVLCFM